MSDCDREASIVQARQLTQALKNLHPSIAQYKTIAAFREQALEYLDSIADENGVPKKMPVPVES